MNNIIISNRLIEKGKSLISQPRTTIKFTQNHEANIFLNDLERYPHAFVLACVMDRQIKAELAWLIPWKLSKKLGGFSIPILRGLDLDNLEKLMQYPEPLHRFPNKMAENLYFAIQRIEDSYSGDAKRIWIGKPSSADIVYSFLGFRGIGQKIGTMATNILARDFKVEFSDYVSIDISVDVHIRRIMKRIGLVDENASDEQIIYRARALNPEFPGILDLPIWEIGENWCKSSKPICSDCYLDADCPKFIR